MDIFGTVFPAFAIILKFLSANAAYSSDAESLFHRFNWDLRVVNKIIQYFEERRQQNPTHELSDEDEELLESTAKYLAKLAGKAAGNMSKIQGSGWLQRGRNQVLWISRRSELQELEAELYEWSNRFDIKLLALPADFKFVSPASECIDAPIPPVIRANMQLRDFLNLPQGARDEKVHSMLKCTPPDEITRAVSNYTSIKPIHVGNDQCILASRNFPPGIVPGNSEFDSLVCGLGQLAVALNCLDPVMNIGLLQISHYFLDVPSRRFFFAQTAPYKIDSMNTLESRLDRSPFPRVYVPLDQRLQLAHRLTEAIFFLHTAGFVHKNITSRSVVILEKADQDHKAKFPFSIGRPYLMGFDMIRTSDMVTKLEGTDTSNIRASGLAGKNWDFAVFQHPDRLLGNKSERYIKNYDIYSLGVVLLQIGLWEPMGMIMRRLSDDSVTWREGLLRECLNLEARVGARYQKLVAWCLDVKRESIAKDADFVKEVLDPLEDMTNALS
ncbi:hypothetical protein N7533_011533 [Penicillium manginii]|jgi:hypothetical protein|uniref:uncharacterized protein n=1 Tax=Penicillium manginii TaxID=203109 RepID=UPI0025481F68|nr:uncharacterized protein N7533_011533 [Penicillium manginii]KAJ5742124.1 hypothetical protein N7533_011533 [Penicillium manginii]